MNTKLRFARSERIEDSKKSALIRLDSRQFMYGEPALIKYYTDNTKTEIDSFMAIGIKNGVGPECYKLMLPQVYEFVFDVVESLPDISSLVHNEVYLYRDPATRIWYKVYSEDGITRILDEITIEPKVYYNISNETLWVSDEDKRVRLLNSGYSQEEVDEKIQEIYDHIDALDLMDLETLSGKIIWAYNKAQETQETVNRLDAKLDEYTSLNKVIRLVDFDLTEFLKKD